MSRLLGYLVVGAIALGSSAALLSHASSMLRVESSPPVPPRPKPIVAAVERADTGPQFVGVSLPLLIALEIAGGALGLATTAGALGMQRARARRHRVYGRYLLQLSQHDEAKPQDVEDMMEAVGHLVRSLPADRARHGQPYIAFELDHAIGASGGLEWSIAVRCPPALAVALDGALSAAYPDARLGSELELPPDQVPGHLIRFRKHRGFLYPLLPASDELASPPLEAIAHIQASLGVPSTIRFALTPTPNSLEAITHRLFRYHENRLARQARWGLPEGGLGSTLNRTEMANASRSQNRGLFWLECVVAADARHTCLQLAAAVQARRGENRLRRRWMPLRQGLYERRFADATLPLVPSPRALISAAEAAHLLALPTARMKGVPVRRTAVPRIPMPPEIFRAPADTEVLVPDHSRVAA